MYRVTLTDEQMAELNRRCHDSQTKPRTRDRLEMLRLAHAGWSIPKVAQHFKLTESRVRHWVKTFLVQGFDALEGKKAPGAAPRITQAILNEIKQQVGQDGRTWTAPQIVAWLQEKHGFTVHRNYLSGLLVKNGLRYKRTTRTVRHRQKPEQVAAKKADLETLKRGHRPD
jgi:transposase